MFKNSYILLSEVSNTFRDDLNHAVQSLNISWWKKSHFPVHLTLGQCYGSVNDDLQTIQVRNFQFKIQSDHFLGENSKQSAFLAPIDVDITDGGWIIVKYKQINVDSSLSDTEATNLEQVNRAFEGCVKQLQASFPLQASPFSFMPHVSIGMVKAQNANKIPSQDEIKAARANLQINKQAIMREIEKLRVLNLYDIKFIYNGLDKKSVVLNDTKLARRNFNISKVSGINPIAITCASLKDAEKLSHFVSQMTQSAFRPPQTNTINISAKHYQYVMGVVEGLYPIQATTAASHASLPQQHAAAAAAPNHPIQAVARHHLGFFANKTNPLSVNQALKMQSVIDSNWVGHQGK